MKPTEPHPSVVLPSVVTSTPVVDGEVVIMGPELGGIVEGGSSVVIAVVGVGPDSEVVVPASLSEGTSTAGPQPVAAMSPTTAGHALVSRSRSPQTGTRNHGGARGACS